MYARMTMIGASALAIAMPLAAQERGTVELGGFGTYTKFDSRLGLDNSIGGGVRVGAFLAEWLSVEFEGSAGKAGRIPSTLPDVNVGFISGRLTAVPITLGPLSILVGAGGDYQDLYVLNTYGYHGLVGAKIKMGDNVALRLDGIGRHMTNGGGWNTTGQLGLSFYRHPVNNVEVRTAQAPMMAHADSVSAAETRRLRDVDGRYIALRDSLGMNRTPEMIASSAAALTIMEAPIHFARARSELSDTAKGLLDEKVAILNANPGLRIIINGYASLPGTDDYNLLLGLRRSIAAKDYLMSKGIAFERLEASTRGEQRPVAAGTGEDVNLQNRRAQFRVLNSSPYLKRP
jgi:peptidoglycan-associated lipoprotein